MVSLHVSQWFAITPPKRLLCGKSSHWWRWEPVLLIVPSWRWARTPPPPVFKAIFFFLDRSMWTHITRLVIKRKSVSHILCSQKIDYLYTVPHHSAGGPSISRSSLCAACVSLLSLCIPHISYNETQEREPWLRGLAWEPTLLSSHSTIYGGLSLL